MTQRYLPLFMSLSLACFGLACSDDGGATTTDDTETGDGDGDTDSDSDSDTDSESMSGDGDGDPATGDGDGDDPSGDGDGDDPSGDGDGDDPSGDGDGDDPSGDGDGDDPSGDGDGDSSGDGDGDPPVGCTIWEIEYDLTGSVFELSDTPMGAGDQVNIVEEPYGQDDHVGPGSIVVRFADVDGEPGGTAWIVSYNMTMDFVVESIGATVSTDLQNDVPAEMCGVTSADLPENEASWEPPGMPGHHSVGEIVCDGFFCGFGGFEDGVPVPVDEVTEAPLNQFVFSSDRTTFTMQPVVVQMDNNSTSTWEYNGTEVSREMLDGPECLCN